MNKPTISPAVFTEINNALLDLQGAEYQTYERPLKRLGRALSDESLTEINAELKGKVDFDRFMAESTKTGGGMVGSHRLVWPDDPEQQLGLTLIMIERLAENPDWAVDLSHHFFYAGRKIMAGIHALASQLLIPFARDYKAYVEGRARPGPPALAVSFSEKVFVVHGHDEAPREAVARFLEKVGLEATILHEQASRGMTVAEKLDEYGDVGFAVILLTPDDLGRAKSEDHERPRARQNVLLELGYFVGRLGRERVCALKRGDLELPSDYTGVVYTPFDDRGAWRMTLAKELQAAGYDVDWNKVMAA